jgi:flagellar hook-associated protein 2
MGSPITFSGFNNIDFGVVLNAIMLQERAPLTRIEAQRSGLQAQNSAFATLASRLGALETAVQNLAQGTSLSKVAASSSDDAAVGISAGFATATGNYDVVVTELAKSQTTVSASTYNSADAVVATAGAITLTRFGDPPIDVVISGSMTLQDIAEAVNAAPNSPVSAAVVQVSPGQYRLVLTGRSTGAANAFTVSFSTPLSGGAGLTFTDTDTDGVSGDSPEDNTQNATDATLTVNQVAITSASNVVNDVIPGVTLTLKKKDPEKVVTVSVTEDRGAAVEELEAFATAYNDLLKYLDEQSAAVAAGKPGIGRDPLVKSLREALRSGIMGAETSGTFTRLAEVGIHFETTGKMTIDEARLDGALDASLNAVKELFGGPNGSGGRFGALKTMIESYTEAGGLVSDVRERIDTQVSNLGRRIGTLEEQLAIRRAALQREFIAADRAMAQLNSQGSSLSQLGGQYRLF